MIFEKLKTLWRYPPKRLLYFIEYTSLSGLNYLGVRSRVFGKVFWLTILIISAIAMEKILVSTFINFSTAVVNINLDAAFLNWNNTFPAVSVCFTRGPGTIKIKEFIKNWTLAGDIIEFGKKDQMYAKLILSYLFVNPSNQVDKILPECKQMNSTCGINLKTLFDTFFPKSCSEVFRSIQFDNKQYNCEELFYFHQTEMGTCLIANSLFSYNFDHSKLPLKFGRTTKRQLIFEYYPHDLIQWTIYVHSPDDYPYANLVTDFQMRKSDTTLYYAVGITEMINQPDVRDEALAERRCRYSYETIQGFPLAYSLATCALQQRLQMELESCNCTMHTSPKEYAPFYCDYYGYLCIKKASIYEKLIEKMVDPNTECLDSCDVMEINIIAQTEDKLETNDTFGRATVDVIDAPIRRYVRRVSKTKLDLVVSVGGVIGLFYGASILSLIEFIYIWCIRKF